MYKRGFISGYSLKTYYSVFYTTHKLTAGCLEGSEHYFTNRVTSPEPETAESAEEHANDSRFFSLLKDDVKIPNRIQSLRSSSGEVSLIRVFQTLRRTCIVDETIHAM